MRDTKLNNLKIIIVIPVYNHRATLRDVVVRTLNVHDSIMVVDDGSTDEAVDELAGLDVQIIRHPVNQGKGAAILSAAKASRKLGMTHMATIDADGQHDPSDLRRFVPRLHEDPFSIIVGKRNLKVKNVPLLSKFGRRFSNFWLRLQTGQSLGDSQSGFRVYPLVVFEKLKFREKGYAFEVEVLVKAAWAGINLQETEISVYYPPVQERVSHFHVLRDNLQISLLNTRLTMMSLLPMPRRRILVRDREGATIFVLHPIKFLKNLIMENTSPGRLAAAMSLGIFVGALPLIGLHTILILFTAGFFRLNKIHAVTASQLCMPPMVPAMCIEAGHFLRYRKFLTEFSIETIGYQGLERIYEWFLGSLVLAPILAALLGGAVYLTAVLIKKTIHA